MATKQKVTMAVVERSAKPADNKTPEQRVDAVRGYLDKMEVVQLQHATGAILIGMELLALKDQLGRGDFMDVFVKQIERQRFSYRSAARYMQDAHRVRRKMIKDGGITLMGILNIAPSALPMPRQRELQKIIAEAVGDRNLTGMRGALGADSHAPRQLTSGTPTTGKAAEMQAHASVWMDLCKKLTHEAVSRKTWKFLDVGERKIVRETIAAALAEIPA